MSVQERKSCTTSEDIGSGLGVFVADGVADLTVDVGVQCGDAVSALRETLVRRVTESSNGPCAIAVGFGQVLGDISLKAVVLDDVDE